MVPHPATHTGGSASHRTHAAVLAETNDKDPTPTDIYEHTHTVNNDRVTWVNKKAERVHKRIEELRKLRSQPLECSSEPQPVDEDQLFLDAVGGPDNKNRVYGMVPCKVLYMGHKVVAIPQLLVTTPSSMMIIIICRLNSRK